MCVGGVGCGAEMNEWMEEEYGALRWEMSALDFECVRLVRLDNYVAGLMSVCVGRWERVMKRVGERVGSMDESMDELEGSEIGGI